MQNDSIFDQTAKALTIIDVIASARNEKKRAGLQHENDESAVEGLKYSFLNNNK